MSLCIDATQAEKSTRKAAQREKGPAKGSESENSAAQPSARTPGKSKQRKSKQTESKQTETKRKEPQQEKSKKERSKSGTRSEVVLPGVVAFYHCWARCVRQSWLCGRDGYTGIDYSHRRGWIEDFARQLAALVGLDACWFAVLSNHMHFILRARPDVAATWSDQEVARRYMTIQRLIKTHDGRSIDAPTEAEILLERQDAQQIAEWRMRLSHPAIFMGSLSEHIARRANKEDKCKGRFFDDRYGCRRLESTAAVLVCALYVDLNVVRAGQADAPETSRSTSAYGRIAGLQSRIRRAGEGASGDAPRSDAPDAWLSPLELDERSDAYRLVDSGSTTGWRCSDRGLLPMSLEAYLELLDWAGRAERPGKPGKIPARLEPILDRMGVKRLDGPGGSSGPGANDGQPSAAVSRFHELFGKVVGTAKQVAQRAQEAGRRWYRGAKACENVFG